MYYHTPGEGQIEPRHYTIEGASDNESYLALSLVVEYDESDDDNDDKQELIAHCCSLIHHL